MTAPLKPNSLQTYQTILYNRALHPEFFPLKDRRVLRHRDYELEIWIMSGSHLLRFEHGSRVASELVTDQDGNLPDAGVVTAFLCAGEREYEHRFDQSRVVYMTNVQTESLTDHLYETTMAELLEWARESGALVHRWADEAGPCLSMLDAQVYQREVHVQAYHMVGHGGVVLRTQTVFEHA